MAEIQTQQPLIAYLCAWCEQDQNQNLGFQISHTICKSCAETYFDIDFEITEENPDFE